MSDVLTRAQTRIARWRESTPQFVVDNFGVEPDAWQLEALRAFDSPDPIDQRISLQACAGPGKTTVLVWCGWKFLSCYAARGEHPKATAVSETWDNLKTNLWPEFAKWQVRSEYLKTAFTWTHDRIFANHHPETWFIIARSWPKGASPEEQGKTLSGMHSQFVLFLVDESGAIPMTVLRAAEQSLSTKPFFGKILQAGNPISLEGMLYAAASLLRHQWRVIRITGDPDDPHRSPRIDRAWAEEQIRVYGRDNPWVMSYILGLFPPAAMNALLGVDEVEAAMKRTLAPDAFAWAQKRLGVDVARYGDDRTVIFPRQGLAAFRPEVLRHQRDAAVSVEIANRVMACRAHFRSELEFFDATGGWAAGAVDVMRANGLGPIDVQFAAPAMDPRYANRRAEIWFQMAKWVQSGGALPPVPELTAELTTPTYVFHKGKFLLEEKDQVKKRLGRSPDLADALALTFGLVDMPGAHATLAHLPVGGRAEREWDPFAVR